MTATVLPIFNFRYANLRLHIALDTAEALIGFLAAYLIFGRFRESRRVRDLILVYSLLVLAGTNISFSILYRSGVPGLTEASGWAMTLGRLLGAAGLAAAAWVARSTVARTFRVAWLLLAWLGTLVVVGIGGEAMDAIVLVNPGTVRGTAVFSGAPVSVLVIQAVSVLLYAVAAAGFTRQAEQGPDELTRWLGPGVTLAAFARVNYFLFPSILTNYVYTGDFLRLGFYLLLLYGSTREIRAYWLRLEDSVGEHEMLAEMKDTLMRAVSHDLKNPITVIVGMSETLRDRETRVSDDTSREMLGRVASSARRVNRVLDDLLDMQRVGSGILEPVRGEVDIAALLRDVAAEAESSGGHPVHVDADGVVGSLDGGRVERIVENLLSNAVKHTPVGTDIRLRARRQGEGVLISVEDAGPGAPEEMRRALFDPFVRGASAAGRAGVGLSLVARFTELHGGRVWVDEREGGGAAFRVLLPDG